MKTFRFLAAFVVLLALYQWTGAVGGMAGKLRFVLVLVALSLLFSLVLNILKRRGGDKLHEPGEARGWSAVEDFLSGPRFTGGWRLLDVLLGIIAAFGPPLVLSLYRGERITWDSDFTGAHFLAMTLGVGVYMVCRTWLWRKLTE